MNAKERMTAGKPAVSHHKYTGAERKDAENGVHGVPKLGPGAGVRLWPQDKPWLTAHRHPRPAEIGKASSANGHAAGPLATQTQEIKAEWQTCYRTTPGRPGSGWGSRTHEPMHTSGPLHGHLSQAPAQSGSHPGSTEGGVLEEKERNKEEQKLQ